MVNVEDIGNCEVCGEHRESGILRHGFFASPYLPVEDVNQEELPVTENSEDSCKQSSLSPSTAVGLDERMLLHAEVVMKSHPHPERPDRLRAIAAILATAGIFPAKCHSIPAREITKEELQMVLQSAKILDFCSHIFSNFLNASILRSTLENIEAVDITRLMLASYFTPDTYANEHSACAARLAAGLCADLASAIYSGRVKNGFALVRPPGHHAGVKQAMGFCLHNNAAIAASAAEAAGAKKVLIVDWGVHHGNGTQEIFERSKSVLYISLHRHEDGRFYPGTGAADEVGSMGAEGYCVNIPWSRGGVGDKDYIFAFEQVVLPIGVFRKQPFYLPSEDLPCCIGALDFNPDFTIISAGFDAARGDPLGCCDVTPAGYASMTQMWSAFYNLRSISSSATAVIKVGLGESHVIDIDNIVPSKSGLRSVLDVLKIQMNFWPTLETNFTKLHSKWGSYAFQDTTSVSLK
ncbi:hypothetical protein K7X08_034399 [Anisodus acutangulus]|uniref:histone deacetylase n=1 Tax=Anisodus acutangulus TaxID=402998 RepID=A0A9Q1R1L1_9SOLA|nr:hypothetical protein K7X08_034399 [Anisodus acutangulus]